MAIGPTLFSFALGFLLLLAASYLGTTMALRGFFGREYYDPQTGERVGPEGSDTTDRSGVDEEDEGERGDERGRD